MNNKIQLITYANRFSGGKISDLKQLLDAHFRQSVNGVHLLPFYYPIDGSDAGFDPIDHAGVDERLGNWEDVRILGRDYDLTADLIVNHMSAESDEFQDVLRNGRDSAYWELFLSKESVFPDGMSEQARQAIYRPRPGSCFTAYKLASGEEVEFWTTFTSSQIDINVESEAGKAYLNNILTTFSESNIKLIRLDAAGYAIKRAGSRCFMLPETFDFIDQLTARAERLGMTTLVEIHSHFETQIAIAEKANLIYDFALPPLVLHTLIQKDAGALNRWLNIAPRNCVTVLDTHDGIGIIDVGPENEKDGLLNAGEVDDLVNAIHKNSGGESLEATGKAASNVDLYQVNCTFFDALGKDERLNLLARAIQFFAPGVPQVYYGGLFGLTNDMDLLKASGVGRDINRPYLTKEKVENLVKNRFSQALVKLMTLRNTLSAFNGEFTSELSDDALRLSWEKERNRARLTVRLPDLSARISYRENDDQDVIEISSLL